MINLNEIPHLLLHWYDAGARVLPWRENPAPYRVWVSEIMLQQTRVEAVKPYFERFMQALPTVEALAQAPQEQILKLWEGLGYYNRVRNLQKAAQIVMEEHGGRLPADPAQLLALPGVGEYTAGAVASIAFGCKIPAVDGNVLRVFARLLGSGEDISDAKVKRERTEQIGEIMPERAGDFNQALMELGAMVCIPNGAPKCGECPLAGLCTAHRQGMEEAFPVKKAKKARRQEDRTVFLLTCEGRAALRRRPEKGLLAGLWELPCTEGKLEKREAQAVLRDWDIEFDRLTQLPDSRHVFTHVEWHMACWSAELTEPAGDFIWADREALEQAYTLPSAFQAYFEELKSRTC